MNREIGSDFFSLMLLAFFDCNSVRIGQKLNEIPAERSILADSATYYLS